MRRISHGLAAGAVGTTLLNAVTYLDMAIRARPASSIPEQDVEVMAKRAGITLGDGETAATRKSAIGALMGIATGISIGAVYGIFRPWARGVPQPLAAAIVGLGAMAATDSASAAMGTTDPKSWSAEDWASDVVPHLAFGAGVVAAFDALQG